MRILAALLCCAGLGMAPGFAIAAGSAQQAGWRCAPGSRERAEAQRMFEALDAGMRALKPADDPAALNEALAAMARHPCMVLSRIPARQLRAEASPALTDFWSNGGRQWIDEHFQMEEREVLTLPPLMRKVISPATRPGHPAAALLCPVADARCGQQTAGWWQRAESHFRRMAKPVPRPRSAADRDAMSFEPAPAPTEASCLAEAVAASPTPPAQRYMDWVACVQATREVGFAMPLGRLRAPATGWLVIRGRRGHYSFCDEVRMYSLATGAAYVSQSCSALWIGSDTRPERRSQVLRGSMSVDNLREALWMLLQLDEVEQGYQNGESFLLPAGLAPDRDPVVAQDVAEPREQIVSSAQTTLAWVWADQSGAALASGTLKWPSDHVRGGPVEYVNGLLQVAEAGIQEGCPAEKPPQNVNHGTARTWVAPIDASPSELSAVQLELVAELNKLARSRCRSPR